MFLLKWTHQMGKLKWALVISIRKPVCYSNNNNVNKILKKTKRAVLPVV